MANRAWLQLLGLLLLAAALMVPAIWAQGRDLSARPAPSAVAAHAMPLSTHVGDLPGEPVPVFPERPSWSGGHSAPTVGRRARLVSPTPSVQEELVAVEVAGFPEQPAHSTGLDSAPAPVRLDIPTLQISASVVPAGIDNTTGELAVGPSAADVYWYELGPAPGQSGTALLAGHLDRWDGAPGVFARLNRLEPGASVLVTLSDGQLLNFTVTGIQRFPADRLSEVYTTAGPPRLVLVTCTGGWDTVRQRYRENLIVEAQLGRPD